jgi:hypothetical protein
MPFQDNFVDSIDAVRARLEPLGEATIRRLLDEGATAELSTVVRRTRAALRAIAG